MNWTRLLERWADTLASIGQLRHRLLLEAPSATPDGAGGTTSVFVPVVTVWAGLHPVFVEAAQAPRQTGETLTHQIFIRYREGVTVGMRFSQGQNHYLIRQVIDPDALKTRLMCLCTQEHG
jgi:SPP1 family predicted phage head-tail adaptor